MQENVKASNPKSSKKIKAFKKKPKKGLTEDKEIEELKSKYEDAKTSDIHAFKDLPLSKQSMFGLRKYNYIKPTLIQQHTIIPALQGRDILGAAKTGSGKTLAFLLPVLEKLYINKWTRLDGLGALIISPTRELAYQTFETLKKVGVKHDFSAGLIIGGKNLHFETKRMDKCNIVICTPGRLLQHMDENPLFDCSNLQLLILDEADRCLDLGFAETMNSIIENLPKERQTLLFSATQTKSIKDLARLSLVDPMYISPHEDSEFSTPSTLQQNYIVCELEDKISFLYSFIRNHLKQKCLVFMASCKQVKYVYSTFCKLRPGTSLLALYGSLHQERREQIYEDFCGKHNVVLFATDLAARGLDFPQVNWVIQLDCPENADTYIHRAGRTARHVSRGESLLVLLPNEEEKMVELLKAKKVPINKIQVDAKKLQSPQRKLESLLAEYVDLKESAQRAFVSYIKSVYLMKNKEVFNVHKLNTDAFAHSLGLVVPPRIRFLQKIKKNESMQNVERSDFVKEVGDELKNNKIDKDTLTFTMDDSDSDDDIMKIKRKDHNIEEELEEPENIEPEKDSISKSKILTKAAVAKKILKKKIVANKKTVFDEEGVAIRDGTKEKQLAQDYDENDMAVSGIDIQKAKEMLKKEDEFDKQKFREKLKARRKEIKKKLKNKQEDVDEFGEESESDVDLSWLPDPDKIYGKQNSDQSDVSVKDNSNGNSSNEEDVSDEDVSIPRSKRKIAEVTDNSKNDKSALKPKKKRKMDIEEVTTSLSLNEAEELAMKLLQ